MHFTVAPRRYMSQAVETTRVPHTEAFGLRLALAHPNAPTAVQRDAASTACMAATQRSRSSSFTARRARARAGAGAADFGTPTDALASRSGRALLWRVLASPCRRRLLPAER